MNEAKDIKLCSKISPINIRLSEAVHAKRKKNDMQIAIDQAYNHHMHHKTSFPGALIN